MKEIKQKLYYKASNPTPYFGCRSRTEH